MPLLILNTVNTLFTVYIIMLFVRIFSSWVPELRQYKAMHFVAYYTDPYLNFFRRFIPPLGMIDISPILAFFCLTMFIQPFVIMVVQLLLGLARNIFFR